MIKVVYRGAHETRNKVQLIPDCRRQTIEDIAAHFQIGSRFGDATGGLLAALAVAKMVRFRFLACSVDTQAFAAAAAHSSHAPQISSVAGFA